MRFIIYGAGGVGGVIGAQLFKASQPVVLVARGEHLAKIRKDGLRYQTPFGDERLQIPAVGHADELSLDNDDVVLITAKSQHTAQVLADLRAAHGDRLPVVCCQNGVANEWAALRLFSRVYAMLVFLPAQLIEPGQVQCHAQLKSGVLDLCRFPGRVDTRARNISVQLEAAGFSVRPDAHVMRMKYAKLLLNLNNALEAVTSTGTLADDLKREAKEEGRSCLEAAGIPFATADEFKVRLDGVYAFGDIPGVERAGGSSRQSLLRGTGDIEADFLNGEIVRLGRLHGVPTPVNAVLQRLAVELARTRSAPGSISHEQLAALVDAERVAANEAG